MNHRGSFGFSRLSCALEFHSPFPFYCSAEAERGRERKELLATLVIQQCTVHVVLFNNYG